MDTQLMSEETVELVRAAMFQEGVDLARASKTGALADTINVTVMAPDMEVAFVTPAAGATEFRGLDGFLEGWGDWMVPWTSFEVIPEEFLDAGERVVALVTLTGQTEHDGVRIEQPAAGVFTVSDGLIRRVEFHLDRREALAAAGLSA
jgi:ketosteroid isomerase-like protein